VRRHAIVAGGRFADHPGDLLADASGRLPPANAWAKPTYALATTGELAIVGMRLGTGPIDFLAEPSSVAVAGSEVFSSTG
jgi:hypothetical protein